MSPAKEHHLLEGLEVNETEQKVHDLLINLILPLLYLLKELFHVESLDGVSESLIELLIVRSNLPE